MSDERTYPVTPALALIACLIAGVTWINTRRIESPPVAPDPGPLWEDGEVLTLASTGETIIWRRPR